MNFEKPPCPLVPCSALLCHYFPFFGGGGGGTLGALGTLPVLGDGEAGLGFGLDGGGVEGFSFAMIILLLKN